MKIYKIIIDDTKEKMTYKVVGYSDGGKYRIFGEYDTLSEAKREARENADVYGSSNQFSSTQYYYFDVDAYRGEQRIGMKASYTVKSPREYY